LECRGGGGDVGERSCQVAGESSYQGTVEVSASALDG
jgi:hypothetical protein